MGGVAATLSHTASHSRGLARVGILPVLPGHLLLGTRFGLLVATVLSTLAPI